MAADEAEARSRRIEKLKFDYESCPKWPIVRCNLCCNKEWTIISHMDRYGFPATTTACSACSLSVLNPQMTPAAYTEFYRKTYRPLVSAYHGRLIDARSIRQEQESYAAHIVGILRRLHSHNAAWHTMLDIGGSTGVVAAHLAQQFGLTPTIIDPAPDEIAEAEKSGAQTIVGFFEDWSEEGRQFDLVGMFQTIDHLLDVSKALKKVHKVLADEGLFIVDILDFRAAYLRAWSVEEATKIDHPFALTQSTMETYLHQTGFSIALKSFSPDHSHVLYLCRKEVPDTGRLPRSSDVDAFFKEIRYVQSTPRSST
jgi:ubiquinone/menaquinone biosynthesis C-methylase UbiE